MEEPSDNDLFAISVDADNYAEAAGLDNPASKSRTYQSEDEFRKIKATYKPKIDDGNTYQDLMTAVPVLQIARPDDDASAYATYSASKDAKARLSKKDVQSLGYAVAELYYNRDYAGVIDLCRRVRLRCEIDGRLEGSLGRWVERCEGRLGSASGG